jgi:hypothetical protein
MDAYDKMNKKLAEMDDDFLLVVWDALRHYDPNEWYEPGVISMDDWAEAVYCELKDRNLSFSQ